jgi:hypothetical protein
MNYGSQYLVTVTVVCSFSVINNAIPNCTQRQVIRTRHKPEI